MPLEVLRLLNAVEEYRKRRQMRLDERARTDDEGDEDNAPSSGNKGGGGHGNTKIPYGLCRREGIKIQSGWTPKDAWAALEGHGYTAGDVYRELRTSGKVAKRIPKTDKETGEITGFEVQKPKTPEEIDKDFRDCVAESDELQKQRKQLESDISILQHRKSVLARRVENTSKDIEAYENTYGQRHEMPDGARRAYDDLFAVLKEENAQWKQADEQHQAKKAELEAVRQKITDPERQKRFMEATMARYPDWDSCEDGKARLERAKALSEADSVKYGNVYDAVSQLEGKKVAYNPVKWKPKPGLEDETIAQIGGGDMTKGSCASVAMAYLAARRGIAIQDFRGGHSQDIMSRKCCGIVRNAGGFSEEDTSDFRACKALFDKMEDGYEYWFATGRHAAVIRKNSGKLEYLELQSSGSNGWRELTTDALKTRFKCKRSHSSYGNKVKAESCLIKASDLIQNKEVQMLLGYINTEWDEQKRGVRGTIK